LVRENYINEYSEVRKQYSALERSLEVLKLLKSVRDDQKAITEENNELANDIKGKETKYIEILGIFAGIITFAAGAFNAEINLAKDPKYNGVTNALLGIGLVLFLFISLLLFVTRVPFGKLWKKAKPEELRKSYLAGAVCFVFLVISILINSLILNWKVNSGLITTTDSIRAYINKSCKLPLIAADSTKKTVSIKDSIRPNGNKK
jgi:uncharacterized membrane protein